MTSRITNQIQPDADSVLQQLLILYKNVATIRDLKQVFFYTEASANITNIPPNHLFYNFTQSAQLGVGTYYTPIGTTRSMDISGKISDLLDIRVPKDKYVIEINLAECVIECGTEGWTSLPDRILRKVGANMVEEPTYRTNLTPGPPNANSSHQDLVYNLVQATKLSSPQTLYVKIREVDNGENYNWSVTNSGAFSIDKSHQVLIRHGDINVSNLTLEFGHLAFQGRDGDYERLNNDPSTNSLTYRQQQIGYGIPKLNRSISQYDQPIFVDYNREVFNTMTQNINNNRPWWDAEIPEFYKGLGGVDMVNINTDKNGGTNIVQPVQRPPYQHYADPVFPNNSYNLQGKPLFYNQQASKIGFRFLIKIIHLF